MYSDLENILFKILNPPVQMILHKSLPLHSCHYKAFLNWIQQHRGCSLLSCLLMPGTDILVNILTESLWGSQSHTWWLSGLSAMTLWGCRDCSLMTQGLTQLLGVACGGGTLVQEAGLHPFLPSATASLLCLLHISSQHVIWTKIQNDWEIASETPKKRLLEDFIQVAAKKNVSHGYIYSWDTLRVL